MQSLLPIIKTALNRLQPPPKHAHPVLPLLFLSVLLRLSCTILPSENRTVDVTFFLLLQLSFNLLEIFLPLESKYHHRGFWSVYKRLRWWPHEQAGGSEMVTPANLSILPMDLVTILCHFMLLSLDLSAATSLITGKCVHKRNATWHDKPNSWLTCGSVCVFLILYFPDSDLFVISGSWSWHIRSQR